VLIFLSSLLTAFRRVPGRVLLTVRQALRRCRNWLSHATSLLLLRFQGRLSPRAREFSNIYYRRSWGPGFGEHSRFFSGGGSHTPALTEPYVAAVLQLLGQQPRTEVVDIGCGDFAIGRRIAPACQRYTGVDIVPALIADLRRRFSSDRVSFVSLDAVSESIPEGNICLIRQVLQHLSNADIVKVLEKLSRFDVLVITEHLPNDPEHADFNRDIESGAGLRLRLNSGVYVDRPPFRLSGYSLTVALELPVLYGDEVEAQGVLRTSVLRRNSG
jgi:SAM-dependent methyltransferase